SEPDVFEIVLPITVFVLSDDDFAQGDAEMDATSLKEEAEQEGHVRRGVGLRSGATSSNDSDSLSVWGGDESALNKGDGVECAEGRRCAEGVGDGSKPCDRCDAGKGGYGPNYVLLTSSCKTEFIEMNETSDCKECDGDGGLQQIPPLLSSAGSEGRGDAIKTSRELTSAVIPKREEELVSVASVLCDGSPEEQPEIHKEMETIVEMEDPDSSKNGDSEANNRKRSECEDEAPSSLLEHGLKEEPTFTCHCSALLLNGCSPSSEELPEDTGKPEMNASTSAESNTTGEHIDKTLTPFPKKRYPPQNVVSPHASPKEFQSQKEGLAWLSNSVTIKPLSKASCSMRKNERLKCRFCSSVYKCSVHLKKHVHSAHKDKKIYK
ncbi:hypothetical protein N330_04991, partial [Leptosomus discolor]